MRMQPPAKLAAKNHAASFASLASPPQKYAIIEVTGAAASLGAPKALAVGQRSKSRECSDKEKSMIIWTQAMSTGIDIIDQQHKMLFEKYNDLSSTISKYEARLTAGELLDFLQFYATWHFAQEEKEMEKYKCTYSELNKKAHKEFVKIFGAFYTTWQEGTMTKELVKQTYDELGKWLIDHILKIDAKLLTFVRNAN